MEPESKQEAEMLAAQSRQELNGLDMNKLEAPQRPLTSLEREVLHLLQTSDKAKSDVFPLHYYPWGEKDKRDVVLIRHKNGAHEPDDFTCHDAVTGRNLGWGEDKKEAESSARFKLMEEHDTTNGK
jgi:hypothetical protein